MRPRHGLAGLGRVLTLGLVLASCSPLPPNGVNERFRQQSSTVPPDGRSGTIGGSASAVVAPPLVYPYTSGIFTFTQASTIRWYSDASNGMYTPGDGNSVSFSFFGVGLHIYGSQQARGATAIQVDVDGVPYTMSCYNGGTTTPAYNQPLLDIPVLPVGTHNVTITNPVRGKYVYISQIVADQPPSVDATAVVTNGIGGTGPIVWGP